MTRSPWFKGFIVGLGAGLAVAVITLLAALDHNPQGEFYQGDALQLGPIVAVGAGWLVAVAAPTWLCAGVVLALRHRRREHHAA